MPSEEIISLAIDIFLFLGFFHVGPTTEASAPSSGWWRFSASAAALGTGHPSFLHHIFFVYLNAITFAITATAGFSWAWCAATFIFWCIS
jgi:hypothetical protein